MAVTGASGYVGTKLLERLEHETNLRKLVAFDINPLPLPVHNIAFYRKDVSEPIEDELNDQAATTLVHLAFNARLGANKREIAEQIREDNEQFIELADCLRGKGWTVSDPIQDADGSLGPGEDFSGPDGDLAIGDIRDCISERNLSDGGDEQ